jgi:hypothetical protein
MAIVADAMTFLLNKKKKKFDDPHQNQIINNKIFNNTFLVKKKFDLTSLRSTSQCNKLILLYNLSLNNKKLIYALKLTLKTPTLIRILFLSTIIFILMIYRQIHFLWRIRGQSILN